jgi:hypothetical protein
MTKMVNAIVGMTGTVNVLASDDRKHRPRWVDANRRTLKRAERNRWRTDVRRDRHDDEN